MEYVALITTLATVLGSFYVGAQRLVTITAMLVEIREQSRLNWVAIEAMRIVDTENNSKIESHDRRLSDLENYVSLMTDPNQPHQPSWQFKPRGKP